MFICYDARPSEGTSASAHFRCNVNVSRRRVVWCQSGASVPARALPRTHPQKHMDMYGGLWMAEAAGEGGVAGRVWAKVLSKTWHRVFLCLLCFLYEPLCACRKPTRTHISSCAGDRVYGRTLCAAGCWLHAYLHTCIVNVCAWPVMWCHDVVFVCCDNETCVWWLYEVCKYSPLKSIAVDLRKKLSKMKQALASSGTFCENDVVVVVVVTVFCICVYSRNTWVHIHSKR